MMRKSIMNMGKLTDYIAMSVVALIIVVAYFWMKTDFETKNPGDNWNYRTETYHGHRYIVRITHERRGQPQMIHSPDCPCHNKKEK